MIVERDIALSLKENPNPLFVIRYPISRAVWFADNYTEGAELEAAKIKMLSFSLVESLK